MKKYYDKVLFLLALAVLGLGAGIFFKGGGMPVAPSAPVAKLSGTPFTVIEKPKFEQASHTWDAPPDQREQQGDPGWTYSVFTPPQIYWTPGVGFTAIPPEPIAPVPFGVHLVSAKKELYRVQLTGISGAGDKESSTFNFYDEDTDIGFNLKIDQEDSVDDHNVETEKLHGIQVKDVTFEQVDKGHGVVFDKVGKVTILDTRTNETIVFTQGEEYAPTDNQLYLLKTDPPFPPQDWNVSKDNYKDQKLTFPGSLEDYKDTITFTVVALDFTKPSVTVEKHFTTKFGVPVTKQQELTLDNNTPAPDQAQPGAAPAASN